MGLLISIVNASNHTKCIWFSNQKCVAQPALINLHPNEYSQEFHYYPFEIKLDRCVGSCNTLNDSSNKVCVPNKIEDLNLSVFNIIAGINESKTSIKHISYKHTNVNVDLMEENVIQISGGIMINVDASVINVMYVKKIMLGILLHVIVKMENI